MQTTIFEIPDEDVKKLPKVENNLSLQPFLNYLKARMETETSIKREFFSNILNDFNKAIEKYGSLNPQNIFDFKDELKLVYTVLNPPLAEIDRSYWALGFPIGQRVFFGTDLLYSLLQDQTSQLYPIMTPSSDPAWEDYGEKARMLYTFIIQKLYGWDASCNFDWIHSIVEDSGLQKYYKVNIDHSFVEVKSTSEIPSSKLNAIRDEYSRTFDLDSVGDLFPLDKVRLEGFSVITIQDITYQQALEDIKRNIIKGSGFYNSYKEIIKALKTLAGVPEIEFSLLPFLKVNENVVFDFSEENSSILFRLLRYQRVDDITIQMLARKFEKNPRMLIYNKEESTEELTPLLSFQESIKEFGLESYALIPVFYNKEIIGVIETYTDKEGVLDNQVLTRIFSASSLLAQLLKDEAIRFEARLNEVIRDKFTAIQSAVYWKFNEEAWKYLQKVEEDKPKPIIEDIKFEQVYPLYGVVDIRNSTIERNIATFKDISTHLKLLENLLVKLENLVNIVILSEMIYTCRQWQQDISEDLIDSFIQMKLKGFLDKDVMEVIAYFKENVPESRRLIGEYEKNINPDSGIVFKNRNALEHSFQLINGGVNRYLELFEKELQTSYPCYFEKFRSDGVEYDIYIGQSIAPNRKFKEIYLKNIRLWQLTSLAAMAKITHSLLDQMDKHLYTTQLAFVNANPIDISFRTDERRFDVEGSYNIRYQIIKKRIDKVLLKDSNERLTQPGKIAIVYLTDKDREEYIGYIQYLQKKDTLLDDLETLELEELQGVKGLKALRVGVSYAKVE